MPGRPGKARLRWARALRPRPKPQHSSAPDMGTLSSRDWPWYDTRPDSGKRSAGSTVPRARRRTGAESRESVRPVGRGPPKVASRRARSRASPPLAGNRDLIFPRPVARAGSPTVAGSPRSAISTEKESIMSLRRILHVLLARVSLLLATALAQAGERSERRFLRLARRQRRLVGQRWPRPTPTARDGRWPRSSGARDAIRRLKAAGPLDEPVRVLVARRNVSRRPSRSCSRPKTPAPKEAPITYAACAGREAGHQRRRADHRLEEAGRRAAVDHDRPGGQGGQVVLPAAVRRRPAGDPRPHAQRRLSSARPVPACRYKDRNAARRDPKTKTSIPLPGRGPQAVVEPGRRGRRRLPLLDHLAAPHQVAGHREASSSSSPPPAAGPWATGRRTSGTTSSSSARRSTRRASGIWTARRAC